MQSMVPCPNNGRCGHQKHLQGSFALQTCATAISTSGNSRIVLPPPAPQLRTNGGRVAAYPRRYEALQNWLRGRNMHTALRAMEYAEHYHDGLRKDGTTPEFEHQVSIVTHLTTLEPMLQYPEATFAVGFLHDVPEDYEVPISEIVAEFGDQIATGTDAMSKEIEGVKRHPLEVFQLQVDDPCASVVKGCDRVHNHGTMVGVFAPEKISSYLEETRTTILPMLKAARRRHPQQDAAYQNVRLTLRAQMDMLEWVVGESPQS